MIKMQKINLKNLQEYGKYLMKKQKINIRIYVKIKTLQMESIMN